MNRFVLAFFATTAVTSISATASAQLWLRDRQATQGPGIRSGDLELHPGIAAEVGYDSNYFHRAPDNKSAGYPVVDTWSLRITPSFHVSTLTRRRREDGTPTAPPKVTFNAGGALIYQEFLTNTEQLGRSRQFGVTADAALAIAPGQPWGLNLVDGFTRTAQPSLDPLVEAGLNRIENRAAAEVVHTRPGGMLDWRLGYAYGLTHFEVGPAQRLNSNRHEIYTRGRWRFLPRTALVYDGSLMFFDYVDPTPGVSSSTPLRTRIGLSGLVTDRLSLLALVGWGASFYDNAGVGNRDFDSVIGQAELRYFFGGVAPEAGGRGTPATSWFALGFTRDFVNSYIGNFYVRNRGYIGLSALFAQHFFVSLDAGASYIQYADVLDRQNGQLLRSAFNNGRIDGALYMEYRFTDWLALNASVQYLQQISNIVLPVGSTLPGVTYAMEFSRLQAFGGIRAFF